MKTFFTKSWLKVFSALFANFAAAYFIAPFIGNAFSEPNNEIGISAIIFDIIIGIIFLSVAHWCERKIENE